MLSMNINRYTYVLNINKKKKFKVKLLTNENMFEKLLLDFGINF